MKTNKSRKRLCSALLCLILTVSMLPITGYADGGEIEATGGSAVQYPIEINEANFPDVAFRTYISTWIDTDDNNSLSQTEIAAVPKIETYGSQFDSLVSLKGIEFFVKLQQLHCRFNSTLTSMDVSQNKRLTFLECTGTGLTQIDVTGLNKLEGLLYKSNRNLQTLHFGNNVALTKLNCENNNKLESIDFNNLANLTELECPSNSLTSLDLTSLTELETLKCNNNRIRNITFANNNALTTLNCSSNIELASLDVSTLTALQTLKCSGGMYGRGKGLLNSLTFGDKNSNLKELDCSSNSLTSLGLSKLTGLTELTCGNNDMESLDVSVLANLKTLDCSAYSFGGDKGSLTSLVFGDTNTNLTNVRCRNNQLTSLNVSRLSKLTSLDCSNNQLTSLDVSGLTNLKQLTCDGNKYTIQVGRDGKFNLSSLPTGFDVNRVTQWTNASVEQKDGRNMLKVDDNASEVTYTYNCSGETNGNPKFTATFTLLVEKEQTYAINVENDGNGTASASVASVKVTSAANGEAVTLTAAPNEGYEFDKWVVADNKVTLANPNSPTTTFTMPASEVTIKASFKKNATSGGSSGGGAYVPSTPPAPSNPKPFGSAVTSDVSGSTSRKDGETSTKVDQSTADKLVDAAIDNKSTDIVIDTAAKTENGGVPNVKASEVTLPTETIKNIAEKTDASLTIKTDVGEIKLDNKAAASVSKQGENIGAPGEQETISIIAKKVKEDTEEVRYELEIKNSGGKTISDFRGGTATITVPIPSGLQGESLICVYIDKKGHYNKVKGKWTADGRYAFSTGHFSTYAMMRESTADTVIAKQKAAVRKMTMKVRTKIVKPKSGKQAIRVTWTSGGKIIPDGVQIYRSTKKGGSFGKKPIFTTEKTRYLNTAVKTGQRYYYKVRGYVTIDGETVYTKLSGKGNRKLPETV